MSSLPRLVAAALGFGLLAACGPPPRRTMPPVAHDAPAVTAVEADRVVTRLILIGDAGDPRLVSAERGLAADEPVLRLAERWAGKLADRTAVVFLGDNIYNDGMPPGGPRADSARARLDAQVAVVERSGAAGLVIPGNHDWRFGKAGLRRQEVFVTDRLGTGSFLPADGAPGPAVVSLPGVRLIVLDTEHWLRRRRGNCDRSLPRLQVALDSLGALLARPEPRPTLVLAHHPLDTYGSHRGMGWLRRTGSGLLGVTQDLGTPAYSCLRRQLSEALAGPHRPLAIAGGHEHSLQVLAGGPAAEYILVSGAGSPSRVKRVGWGPTTLYAAGHPGFMVIDFLSDHSAVLRTVLLDGGLDGTVSFVRRLR